MCPQEELCIPTGERLPGLRPAAARHVQEAVNEQSTFCATNAVLMPPYIFWKRRAANMAQLNSGMEDDIDAGLIWCIDAGTP